jgi:alkylmercury lyase-like protein
MPDLDVAVKLKIYETLAETGDAPGVDEVAGALGRPPVEIAAAFQALAAKRLLVLEPSAPERIRMAPPFSGVETSFRVVAAGRRYFANCVWDALGISAALHRDAVVEAACGDCEEPMRLEVREGKPVPRECMIHFAVPAARWWDDIIYT